MLSEGVRSDRGKNIREHSEVFDLRHRSLFGRQCPEIQQLEISIWHHHVFGLTTLQHEENSSKLIADCGCIWAQKSLALRMCDVDELPSRPCPHSRMQHRVALRLLLGRCAFFRPYSSGIFHTRC